ncbi:MAG: anti-sigma factor [Planctomycetota bacterium]
MNQRHRIPDHEEIQDLMATRAVDGLSELEEAKLRRLLGDFPGSSADDLELSAAALDRALRVVPDEPLPDHLRRAVLSEYRGGAEETPEGGGAARFPLEWLVAAAAVVLALVAWLPRLGGNDPVTPEAETPRSRLARLTAEADDLLRCDFATPDRDGFRDVSGEVIWSSRRQEGYLRLSGLPENAKLGKQYQLWIVDADRDAEHPVDGGVFDFAPTAGESDVIVPIRAALDCPSPDVFALTLETPGGVVVSKGPLLVVAKAD